MPLRFPLTGSRTETTGLVYMIPTRSLPVGARSASAGREIVGVVVQDARTTTKANPIAILNIGLLTRDTSNRCNSIWLPLRRLIVSARKLPAFLRVGIELSLVEREHAGTKT